jgi:hypothetical protein
VLTCHCRSAADADADVGLVPRTRALARLAAVDAPLRDRLVAAHLAARPPAAGQGPALAGEVDEWWEQAIVLTARLVAAGPAEVGSLPPVQLGG